MMAPSSFCRNGDCRKISVITRKQRSAIIAVVMC
jgi:hypothetical protein